MCTSEGHIFVPQVPADDDGFSEMRCSGHVVWFKGITCIRQIALKDLVYEMEDPRDSWLECPVVHFNIEMMNC